MHDHPVIVLAFADAVDARAALRLRDEQRAVQKALNRFADNIRIVSFATRQDLFGALDADHERIVGLHFGGHGDADGLQIEDEDGQLVELMAGGFVGRLSRLPALELVFLNGCHTARHGPALRAACPAAALVLAEGAIQDTNAIAFASQFYRALATGASYSGAFERATDHRSSDPDFVERSGGAVRLLRAGDGAVFAAWSIFGGALALGRGMVARLEVGVEDVLGLHLKHALARLSDDGPVVDAVLARILAEPAGVAAPRLADLNATPALLADLSSVDGLLRSADDEAGGYVLMHPRLEAHIARRLQQGRRSRWWRWVGAAAIVLLTIGVSIALARWVVDQRRRDDIERSLSARRDSVSMKELVAAWQGGVAPERIAAILSAEPSERTWRLASEGPQEEGEADARIRIALAGGLTGRTDASAPPRSVEAQRFGRLLAATRIGHEWASTAGDRGVEERARDVESRVVHALRLRFGRPDETLRASLIADMRPYPGGVFQMGSPESEAGRVGDERPHVVYLSPFALGRRPITREQFGRFFDREPSRVGPPPDPRAGVDPEGVPEAGIDWYEATAFAAWLDLRLPTEAEWAYAVRGLPDGDPRACDAQGAALARIAHVEPSKGDVPLTLLPSRHFEASAGLYAMRANVPTWCADWYGPYRHRIAIDPAGPVMGDQRVQRGGGPGEALPDTRCARRHKAPPSSRLRSAGVRLACDHCVDRARGP